MNLQPTVTINSLPVLQCMDLFKTIFPFAPISLNNYYAKTACDDIVVNISDSYMVDSMCGLSLIMS